MDSGLERVLSGQDHAEMCSSEVGYYSGIEVEIAEVDPRRSFEFSDFSLWETASISFLSTWIESCSSRPPQAFICWVF